MREDLGAYGNELNYYLVACKSPGHDVVEVIRTVPNYIADNTAYVIGQIPLMTLQTKAKM